MPQKNAAFFRFRISPESQAKIDRLVADTQALAAAIETLPESHAHLLQPIFERFLGILDGLSHNLVLVEGNAEFEATGTRKG